MGPSQEARELAELLMLEFPELKNFSPTDLAYELERAGRDWCESMLNRIGVKRVSKVGGT